MGSGAFDGVCARLKAGADREDQLFAAITIQVYERAVFEASWERMVLLAALAAANNAGDLPPEERHKARQQPNLATVALAQRVLRPAKVQLAAPYEGGNSP